MNQGAFLMRGLENVRAEFSVAALVYNLRRALKYSRRRRHGEGRPGLKVAEAALNRPITAHSAPLTRHQAANSAQNDENLVSFASRNRLLQLPRVFARSARNFALRPALILAIGSFRRTLTYYSEDA
jgi:hypothetical protein